MQIAGLTTTAVSSLPYLLGDNAQTGKKNNWGTMPIGTEFSFMLGRLKQMSNGYQGQSFITSEVLYLPPEITTIEAVATLGESYTMPLVSVLQRAITEDKTIKVGSVYKIKYLGKVNGKGQPVNYDNFEISAYNSPELDSACQARWLALNLPAIDPSMQYSTTDDLAKGGELLVENGVCSGAVAQAPVAQAPIAQAPVAQAPVAQAPVAQAPVAQAPVAQADGTPPPPIKFGE